VRAFLAIPLPPAICDALARFGGTIPKLRAQKPGTIHLTIRFLGEIRRAQEVVEAVAPVAAAHPPFAMELGGVEAFPRSRAAHVVWVGLRQGDLEAGALAAGVENALLPLGFPREGRPWKAHVTIGRFPRPAKFAAPAPPPDFGAATADRLVLYRSVLTPEGALHEALQELSLGRGM
jgi:2'-5' RNA ligase